MPEKNIKNKTTAHKFEVDFLRCRIEVIIGDTLHDAIKTIDPEFRTMEGLSPSQINETVAITIKAEESGRCILCFGKEPDINTIVHESVHVVNYIIGYYDLAFDTEEDEIQAYLTGFVVDRVLDALEVHQKENTVQVKAKSKKKTKS